MLTLILFKFGKLKHTINLYSPLQLLKKYGVYFFTASNGKGHGTHSPFVFDFIKNVLTDKKKYASYAPIEEQRKCLLGNTKIIEVTDFGAGSTTLKTNKRRIKNIAQSSLKPKKYAQLLFRMVQYYQPKTIVELGTSLGITTAYLATGNIASKVFTCEGAAEIAAIAQQNFKALQINNIKIIEGPFAKTLPPLLSKIPALNFAYVDGHHKKLPTLQYFDALLQHANAATIMVFDDIHWSKEMEAAWEQIKLHPQITLTIDLFFVGIIFFNTTIKNKQHFVLRF